MLILGSSLPIVAASLLSFVVTFLTVLWLVKGKVSWGLDHPNSRSLHTVPVPRIGGVGMILGVLSAWLSFSVILPATVWIGVSLLILISLADDIWRLPVWCRLFIHIVVAVGFSTLHIFDTYGWMMALLVSIVVIWMSNLYNFMDGSDGLAGGMALIGFGYYGLFALLAGNTEFAMINFSIAAAACAFLIHNFYPAHIFMGDVGAIPLGFMAAVLGILGWIDGLWSMWFPLLVFSPFIIDATVTLTKRCLRGEKIWQAHCEHYYQRMVHSGLGHRNTALLCYVLMLAVGASAVWAAQQDFILQCWVGAVWGSVYLVLMFISDWYPKHAVSRR